MSLPPNATVGGSLPSNVVESIGPPSASRTGQSRDRACQHPRQHARFCFNTIGRGRTGARDANFLRVWPPSGIQSGALAERKRRGRDETERRPRRIATEGDLQEGGAETSLALEAIVRVRQLGEAADWCPNADFGFSWPGKAPIAFSRRVRRMGCGTLAEAACRGRLHQRGIDHASDRRRAIREK